MNSAVPPYLLVAGALVVGLMVAQGDTTTPAPSATRGKHKSASEVTLQRAANGHFYADAEINGSSVHVLADTGASAIVLCEADAEGAGIDPDTLDYTVPVSTSSGKTTAAEVTLDEVRIGPILRRDVRGFVVKNINGSLLGMSFFNTLSGYEVSSDELVLKD